MIGCTSIAWSGCIALKACLHYQTRFTLPTIQIVTILTHQATILITLRTEWVQQLTTFALVGWEIESRWTWQTQTTIITTHTLIWTTQTSTIMIVVAMSTRCTNRCIPTSRTRVHTIHTGTIVKILLMNTIKTILRCITSQTWSRALLATWCCCRVEPHSTICAIRSRFTLHTICTTCNTTTTVLIIAYLAFTAICTRYTTQTWRGIRTLLTQVTSIQEIIWLTLSANCSRCTDQTSLGWFHTTLTHQPINMETRQTLLAGSCILTRWTTLYQCLAWITCIRTIDIISFHTLNAGCCRGAYSTTM